MKKKVIVNDLMQRSYSYVLTESSGKNFDEEFKPELTPKQMLELGVFGGKYMTDCGKEFPKSWFIKAKLNSKFHDANLNFFKINASQPLSIWIKKGWIFKEDPRGWFQWYCRYYLGRRIPEMDKIQIKRWKAIKRHISQLKKNCIKKDLNCRPKQRQALLHWAIDSRKI
jgi:hypothetical protein